MDDSQRKSADASATRKRRSSILKSQRPPRAPFSDLEFNVATPTDTAKSRRVSFSKRTGVAEFVTNEATTTWKNFYEEHNRTLELSGNDLEVKPPRASVGHIGKRIFEQQFQVDDQIFTLDDGTCPNIETSVDNANFNQQIALECAGEEKVLNIQNLEFSALTEHTNRIFSDDLAISRMDEVSDHISVNFSKVQSIAGDHSDLDEIQSDLNRFMNKKSNIVCPGPFGGKDMSEYIEIDLNKTSYALKNDESDMSITDTILSPKVQDISKNNHSVDKKSLIRDWTADKENIVLNPYVAPKETANFAINDDTDKVLVFDGKRLTIHSEKDNLDKPERYSRLSQRRSHNKSTVSNIDLPDVNSHDSGSQQLDKISKSYRSLHNADLSMTLPLETKIVVNPDKSRSLYSNDNDNISMTQALASNILLPQMLTEDVENVDENISMTQAVSSKILLNVIKSLPERRKTIVFEDDSGDISVTQAIKTNILEAHKFELKNDKNNKRSILFETNSADVSITQAVPVNLLLSENVSSNTMTNKRRTIVYDNEEGNISMTAIVPSNFMIQSKSDEKRSETMCNDDADMSVTRVLPTNLILNESSSSCSNKKAIFNNELANDTLNLQPNIDPETFTKDNIEYEYDISITQAVPRNLILTKDLSKSSDKRKTIHFDNEEGNISLTRSIPCNLILPEVLKALNKSSHIHETDRGNISVAQCVPRNETGVSFTDFDRTSMIVYNLAEHISRTEPVLNSVIPGNSHIDNEIHNDSSVSTIVGERSKTSCNTLDIDVLPVSKHSIKEEHTSKDEVTLNNLLRGKLYTDNKDENVLRLDLMPVEFENITNSDVKDDIALGGSNADILVDSVESLIEDRNTLVDIDKLGNVSVTRKPVKDNHESSSHKQLKTIIFETNDGDISVTEMVSSHSLDQSESSEMDLSNKSSKCVSTHIDKKYENVLCKSISYKNCTKNLSGNADQDTNNDNIIIIQTKSERNKTFAHTSLSDVETLPNHKDISFVKSGVLHSINDDAMPSNNVVTQHDINHKMANHSNISNYQGKQDLNDSNTSDDDEKIYAVAEDIDPQSIFENADQENNNDNITIFQTDSERNLTITHTCLPDVGAPPNQKDISFVKSVVLPSIHNDAMPPNNVVTQNIINQKMANHSNISDYQGQKDSNDNTPEDDEEKYAAAKDIEPQDMSISDDPPLLFTANNQSKLNSFNIDRTSISKCALLDIVSLQQEVIDRCNVENIMKLNEVMSYTACAPPVGKNILVYQAKTVTEMEIKVIEKYDSKSVSKTSISEPNNDFNLSDANQTESESDTKPELLSDEKKKTKRFAILNDLLDMSNASMENSIIDEDTRTLAKIESKNDNVSKVISKTEIVSDQDNISETSAAEIECNSVMMSSKLDDKKYFYITKDSISDIATKLDDDNGSKESELSIHKEKKEEEESEQDGHSSMLMKLTSELLKLKKSRHKNRHYETMISNNTRDDEDIQERLNMTWEVSNLKNAENTQDLLHMLSEFTDKEPIDNTSLKNSSVMSIDDDNNGDNTIMTGPVRLNDLMEKVSTSQSEMSDKDLGATSPVLQTVSQNESDKADSVNDTKNEPFPLCKIYIENNKSTMESVPTTSKNSDSDVQSMRDSGKDTVILPKRFSRTDSDITSVSQSLNFSIHNAATNTAVALTGKPSDPNMDHDDWESVVSTVSDFDANMRKSSSLKKSGHKSNDVVKKLHFEEDSYYEDSTNNEIMTNPLIKTAYERNTYVKENKGNVIPTYLKDVSDGIKALMTDLVKPVQEIMPFESSQVERLPSTRSLEVQANITSSSQIDLAPENISARNIFADKVFLPRVTSFKVRNESPQSITRNTNPTVREGENKVLLFDPTNPLNNVLLAPMHDGDVHTYNPVIPNEEAVVKNQSNQDSDSAYQVDFVETKYNFDKINIIKPNCKSMPIIKEVDSESNSLKSIVSKPQSIDESTDARLNPVKDMEVNTMIAMKGTKELLENSSSLTLVDDTVGRAIYDDNDLHIITSSSACNINNISAKECTNKDNECTNEDVLKNLILTESSLSLSNAAKRGLSPMKKSNPSESVDITPKPATKILKMSTPPIVKLKEGSVATDRQEAQNSRKAKKNSLKGRTTAVHRVTTDYDIKKRNLSENSDDINEEAINDTDLGSLSSFANSRVKFESVADKTTEPVYLTTKASMDWQPELLNELSSKNLVAECESGVNVVAKIDMLPFMGTRDCEWDTTGRDSWTFRLLHGRLRLIVRLVHRHDNASRTVVWANTGIMSIMLEVIHQEIKNPVAFLCIRFAMQAMQYYISQCTESGAAHAGDVPGLLRRCAGVSRVALRWGRAMHEAHCHLAFSLRDNGELSLKVANLRMRSVWEVHMQIAMAPESAEDTASALCPVAECVRITPVVSDCDVSERDVVATLHGLRRDWGHAPKTVWSIFRYLKNMTPEDKRL